MINDLKRFIFENEITQMDILKATRGLDRGRLSHIVSGRVLPSQKEVASIRMALYALGFNIKKINQLKLVDREMPFRYRSKTNKNWPKNVETKFK